MRLRFLVCYRAWGLILGLGCVLASFAAQAATAVRSAGPTHRWAFNNLPGGAQNGTAISDLIGQSSAFVRGDGARFTGTELVLPGGSSLTAPYIDLPNGLLSENGVANGGTGELTIECWVMVRGNQVWSRIFDFGTSSAGEIGGPGGSFAGRDYLIYSAQVGVNVQFRRVELRNDNADPQTGIQGADFATTTFGTPVHVALTWIEQTQVIRVYENGVLRSAFRANASMSQINDVNNWLGRSNYSQDNNLLGNFNEFRIYNRVLSDDEIARSSRLGPELVFPIAGVANYFRANLTTRDAMGNLEGTAQDGLAYTPDGLNQSAFLFAGNGESIALSGNTSRIPVPWTLGFWLRREDTDAAAAAVLTGPFAVVGETAIKAEQFGAGRRVGFTQYGVVDHAYNYIAPAGRWVHLTLVAEGNGTSLYENGVFIERIAAAFPLSRTQIGNQTDRLKGALDELTIFPRGLSSGEIATLMNATAAHLSRPVGGSIQALSGTAAPFAGLTVDLLTDVTALDSYTQVPYAVIPPAARGLGAGFEVLNIPSGSGPIWSGGPQEFYGAVYDGAFSVPAGSGNFHHFELTTDDGGALFLDSAMLATIDSNHGAVSTGVVDGSITPGVPHAIQARMFNRFGQRAAIARWELFVRNGRGFELMRPEGGFLAYYYDFNQLQRTSTDAQGQFYFPDAPVNLPLRVRVSKPDFVFANDGIANVVSGQLDSTLKLLESPPTISDVPDQVIDEDGEVTVTVNVADFQSAPETLNLEVSVAEDKSNLFSGGRLALAGAGQTRTITIRSGPNANGTATIKVRVTDPSGKFAEDSFAVTVVAQADPPIAGSRTVLQLDGTDDGVFTPSVGGFDSPTGARTIEAWIRPTSARSARTWFLVMGDYAEGAEHWLFTQAPNRPGVLRTQFGRWGAAGPEGVITNVDIPIGRWIHLATVWRPDAGYTLFTNGVQVATVAVPRGFNTGSGRLSLAIPPPSPSETRFVGAVDELRVWNRALDVGLILRNFRRSLTGREPGLAMYWRFDEETGSLMADSASDPLDLNVAGGRSDGLGVGLPARSARSVTDTNTGFGQVLVGEDTLTEIYLNGYDAEFHRGETSVSPTYRILSLPQKGKLNRTEGVWNSTAQNPLFYQPNPNATGADSFTYALTDSAGAVSAVARLDITITDVNDLPEIKGLPAEVVIEEDTSSQLLRFVVTDPETPPQDLVVGFEVLRSSLTQNFQVRFEGSGSNRTAVITPPAGQIGEARLLFKVTDGNGDVTSIEIGVNVIPKPAYAVFDLGSLPAKASSFGAGINDLGWVVGTAQNIPTDPAGFLNRGFDTLEPIAALGIAGSTALGINGSTVVGGNRLTGKGFSWVDGTVFTLGTLNGGTTSEGRAVNDLGVIAGVADDGGSPRAVIWSSATNAPVLLDPNPAGVASEAFALNSRSLVVGYRTVSGRPRAALFTSTNVIDLGTLPEHRISRALGINQSGVVVGYSQTQATNSPRAFRVENGVMTDLGTLPGGSYAVASAINDPGQIVGWAGNSESRSRAFLYSAQKFYDLNELIPPDAGWNLTEARAINKRGWIVGTGTLPGGEVRAFLAVPARVIGKQIARPLGSVARYPEITLVGQTSAGDNAINSFHWSDVEGKLYAIRPVRARLNWFTSFENTVGTGTNITANTNRISDIGVNVWPRNPTRHIAGSPVELQPAGVPLPYNWQNVEYDTSGSVQVDPNTKIYRNTLPGYSVLRYLITSNAPAPNPQIHPPTFDVVRTYLWEDPVVRSSRSWLIGDTITYSNHFDYFGKNGFVFFERAFYDGTGAERAYDRPSRTGPIIPVNTATSLTSDPAQKQMVVVWYQTNRLGVAWAGQPVLYELSWPEQTPNKIIIASGLGAGLLPEAQFREKRVYNQPDPSLPGFNPNEEHALISAGSVGTTMYALRNDLNARSSQANASYTHSAPFALLKYRDGQSGDWRIRPYRVIAEEAPYFFVYPGIAGNQIQPPLPLTVLPLCSESYGVSGPFWEDFSGTLFARAAGPDGGGTNVVVRWFYPLQPGFFFDLEKNDGVNEVADGGCIAWLDRLPNGRVGVPVDVTYQIRWPDTDNILQVGETLLRGKKSRIEPGNLPEIRNQARAEIIFDSLSPQYDPFDPFSSLSVTNLARLYDPVSARILKTNVTVPASIERRNVAGQEEFSKLPWPLKIRLRYDPINRWMIFRGYLDLAFDSGEPLLLPNVMTERERDTLISLAQDSREWVGVVTNLYNLSRNPNQVDVDHRPPSPDLNLRVGLVNEYVLQIRKRVTNVFLNTMADLISTNRLVFRPDDAPNLNEWVQRKLGVGLVSSSTNGSGAFILATNVVPEALGDQPKALTAALGSVPLATPLPGSALRFDGATASASSSASLDLVNQAFTVEFWAKRDQNAPNQILLTHSGANPDRRLVIGFRFDQSFQVSFDGGASGLLAPPGLSDTAWHHWACSFDPINRRRVIYRDGAVVASDSPTNNYAGGAGPLVLGRGTVGNGFLGELDEFRLWNSSLTQETIARRASQRLKGTESTLLVYYRFDEGSGGLVRDLSGHGLDSLIQGAAWVEKSTAPAGIPPRYVTVAVNNDVSLASLGVELKVIRIDDGPFAGDLKVLPGDNIFDQRVSFRHSSEFGGDPGPFEFEWYFQEDHAGFDPTDLPFINSSQSAFDAGGWKRFTGGPGINDVTTGGAGQSGLIVMSDTWWICRYRGYAVNRFTTNDWAGWVGDPSGTLDQPRAKLSEGWVKRVIRGLNPFDSRISDFHSASVNTLVSMIAQAGRRYEGDIAFNPSADNVNGIGLIEAYETVLRKARSLSIDANFNFDPANNALLLVGSKISDLYMLLGNEAYADAQDPTIGFGSASADYGSLSSSIFAFQNQLDSLLEEELSLLRGRDDRNAGIGSSPVYNRLFWNFTLGEGEIAYKQVYNIKDTTGAPDGLGVVGPDGFVDERDALRAYPQGHGDAWGHYLTAITTYYQLLRHPHFTWVPRAENVSVSGVALRVDFLDERKFAKAAAARAKAGKEIVDLTYRQNYTEDVGGQWQGYQDTDPDRAWGVTEWARRAGQGAYFDWLVANAILPAEDPIKEHTGIERVDRTTVTEISEITAQAGEVQSRLDMADAGLNPLGLVKGAMVFDIDPTFNAVGSTAQIGRQAVQGLGHFEQIKERAVKGLNNAGRVWDEANRASQQLRGAQDSQDAFSRDYRVQENDYKNRLIEIFGYPYAGDIGPGKTYPGNYDGPDLYHYMYVNTTELTGENSPPSATFTGLFKNIYTATGLHTNNYYANFAPAPVDTTILAVPYTLTEGNGLGYGFTATPQMGQRRAQGELQLALSDLVQANAQLKINLQNYDGLLQDIVAATNLLAAHYDLNASKVVLLKTKLGVVTGINALIGAAKAVQVIANRVSKTGNQITESIVEATPKVIGIDNDVTAPIRGVIKLTTHVGLTVVDVLSDASEIAQQALELSKESVELGIDLSIVEAEQRFEILQRVKELEALLRNEAAKRLEVYNQLEVVRQTGQRFLSKLAEGQRLIEELVTYRKNTSATITEQRYQDMTFRIFRNDAIQKYRAQFDLASRYCYLAATVYDYETAFLGTDARTARQFLQDIIRQRALGQLIDGNPIVGSPGLAESIARLEAGFESLRGQFGINNPQLESGAFRLRQELFRVAEHNADQPDTTSDDDWRGLLRQHYVENLWNVPEFRRYCRPFAPESAGPQSGLVIPFSTTVSFGRNFFGWPLSGGDSAYDPTLFSTKINAVGIQFDGYDAARLSRTPRVYLIPAGTDILRSPTGDSLATREFRVFDQALPIPVPLGAGDLGNLGWIPMNDTLSGQYGAVRRFSSMRAYPTEAFADLATSEIAANTRLVGRSVWNTRWLLIIPGGTVLANPDQGIDQFIQSVSDIRLLIMTYAYAGN